MANSRNTPLQKVALTTCERAFKEWLDESFGAVSPAANATYWQAFRAGWYARQGGKP
jgi:hypothetical protein